MININDVIEAVNDAEFDIDYKGIFTIAKSLWTTLGIYNATKIWKAKGGDDELSTSPLAKPAVRLLGFNALLVVLITIYKLTRREIAPLFVLQCLGHYSCFLVFATLAGFGSHPKIKKGKRGDRRISLAIWMLHLLYAVVLVVGFMWAECVEGSVYPISFVMSDSLFMVSYVLLLYVKRRGFDINDLKEDNNDADADSEEDLELFESQVAAFFSQQRILVIWQIVELFVGFVLLNNHEFFQEAVTCSENNDAWVFNFRAGKLFLLMHTFGVKQSLGVASKVFFKTVKKLDKKRKKERAKKKEQ